MICKPLSALQVKHRTESYRRKSRGTRATTTIATALDIAEHELGKLRSWNNNTLYSDLTLGKKGQPLSSSKEPTDPAVGIRFKVDSDWKIIFCDLYDRVRDNLMEVVELLKALMVMRFSAATYADFVEPSSQSHQSDPQQKRPSWCDVLDVEPDASQDEIKQAYREKAKKYHPDLASNEHDRLWRTQKMQDINAAYQAATAV